MEWKRTKRAEQSEAQSVAKIDEMDVKQQYGNDEEGVGGQSRRPILERTRHKRKVVNRKLDVLLSMDAAASFSTPLDMLLRRQMFPLSWLCDDLGYMFHKFRCCRMASLGNIPTRIRP